jgi:outer membrane protein TolC
MEHFNNNVAMVSITPSESAKLSKSGGSIPFGQNIARVGIALSMPVYVREIFENKQKLSHLLKSAKYKTKIDLLNKEVMIITFLSNYNYLVYAKMALLKQRNSIQRTIDSIKVGVENGAIPEFNLLKLKDSLNQIKINILNIETQLSKIKSQIFAISRVVLDNHIPLMITNYTKDEYISLKPIKESINADFKDIEAKKSTFYPNLYLKAKVMRNWTRAYNTDDITSANTASIGLYLEWDIFDKKNREIQKAKINLSKDMLTLNKTRDELQATELKLSEEIDYLNTQIKEMKNSIKLKKELLKSAKVAFINSVMTVDEYLKYEDSLSLAKANLAKLIAQKNIAVANLAFIYGNDITKVFKEKK